MAAQEGDEKRRPAVGKIEKTRNVTEIQLKGTRGQIDPACRQVISNALTVKKTEENHPP